VAGAVCATGAQRGGAGGDVLYVNARAAQQAREHQAFIDCTAPDPEAVDRYVAEANAKIAEEEAEHRRENPELYPPQPASAEEIGQRLQDMRRRQRRRGRSVTSLEQFVSI
jgi:hypothetical protein